MCYICCSYAEPLVPVHASVRLLAAKADEKQTEAFLANSGFTGLKFKRSQEDLISFFYKDVDMKALTKVFGPVANNSSGSMSAKFGKAGSIVFWPAKKLVILRNSKKGSTPDPLPRPGKKVPEPPIKRDPIKTGTENDDDKVPVTKISTALSEQYAQAQQNPSLQKSFLVKAWKELNLLKFGGKMYLPILGFLKAQGATRMRLRGVWYPSRLELRMSPRMFNASQDFFIEVLLHEMCHQATTTVSRMTPEERADDNKHKGHGRVWASWMRKVGLNPLRYDPNENTAYMTEQERDVEQHRRKVWEQTKKDAEARELRPARPAYGVPVIVRRTASLERGIAVCTTGKTTKNWAVIPLRTVEIGQSPNYPFTWFISSPENLYADPEGKNWVGEPKFDVLGQAMIRHYQRKSERRQAKKIQRFW